MQRTLKKFCTRLRYMNAAERSLGQSVWRHQSQAINTNVMDTVHSLQHTAHPLEALKFEQAIWNKIANRLYQ